MYLNAYNSKLKVTQHHSIVTSAVDIHNKTRFLSPFPIPSVAIWITVFARFDRCLNLFQSLFKSISIDYKILQLIYFAAFFWDP